VLIFDESYTLICPDTVAAALVALGEPVAAARPP
jgi:hypothetical protein